MDTPRSAAEEAKVLLKKLTAWEEEYGCCPHAEAIRDDCPECLMAFARVSIRALLAEREPSPEPQERAREPYPGEIDKHMLQQHVEALEAEQAQLREMVNGWRRMADLPDCPEGEAQAIRCCADELEAALRASR